jgi:aryl-alcohol dehydrogenase-like predicted oxidoreductase
MQLRSIGSLTVTVAGLGTNNVAFGTPVEDFPPVVEAALDQGINFFDTSDSYGVSEEELGKAVRHCRDEVVIATKFGSPINGQQGTGGARPEYIHEALDASLRRLGTDWIDLYQMHFPDPETPIGETLAALGEAMAAGKVREIGCSNISAPQLREAQAAAGDGPRFVSVQNRYNLLERADEADVLPLCHELEIAYLPFFPLASGVLTGKYRRGQQPPEGTRLQRFAMLAGGNLTDATFDKLDALTSWAQARGHSLLDVAVAWLAAHPVVASVIAGATKAEQVAANVAAADWKLQPDEVAEIERIAGP